MPPRAATLPLLIVQGDWTEAHDLATVTRVHGSPLERQMAVTILGDLAHYQGDTHLAWDMVHELLPRGPASEPGDALFPYGTESLRLAVRLALDASDIDEAREWLETHDRWLDWSGAVRGRAESMLLWGQLHQLEGNLPRSEHCAREALRLATDPRQPLTLLATYRFLGQLSMNAQRFGDAENELTHALSLADSCATPYERARTLLVLADLYHLTRREKEVQPLLADIRNIANRLEAPSLYTALENLDAKLRTNASETSLTAREIEVLRLVTQGITDAEVAEQLYISPRTVGQHLRSIYNKLGVSSRTAATRRAVEDHLV
jgi:DNA-binding CsgD family transcriptional regulator